MKPWIGVDLDGTLAHYDKHKSHTHIGAPIPAMVERVKAWLAEGVYDVRIVTARVSLREADELWETHQAIDAWCREHIGQELEVTCSKDWYMVQLWDDRAIQVEHNTGRPIIEVVA